MRPRLAAALSLASGVLVPSCNGVLAADFPSRPLRIVTAAAGGTSDTTARLIARSLTRTLGQQVLVDNRGGNGVIPGQAVAQAAPDGHTLLFYGSTVWLLPMLVDNVPFDPERDFAPVALLTRSPMVLVVHPSLPVKSVKDLIALAKARPGELNYGSAGIGGTNHLAPELFKVMAGVDIVNILYKGVAPALSDLMGGRLHLMFPAAASAMPHVRGGKLRGLAVSTAQPTALAPDLPTVAAAGVPGFEAVYLTAMQAPARTPAPVIALLNQEVVRALNEDELKEKFFGMGSETVGSSPEALADTMKAEVAKWGKLIERLGIRSR